MLTTRGRVLRAVVKVGVDALPAGTADEAVVSTWPVA